MIDPSAQEPQTDCSQGTELPWTTDQERHAAVERAFDYRGDVTIHTTDGRAIQGYVFDRRTDVPQPYVRLIPTHGAGYLNIGYADISGVVLSSRDPAAGKSWEAWVKRYQEKRALGESVSLEPELLD